MMIFYHPIFNMSYNATRHKEYYNALRHDVKQQLSTHLLFGRKSRNDLVTVHL